MVRGGSKLLPIYIDIFLTLLSPSLIAGATGASNGSGRGYIMTAPGRVSPPAPTAFAGQGFSLGGGGSVDASNRNKENMRKARLAAVHASGKSD